MLWRLCTTKSLLCFACSSNPQYVPGSIFLLVKSFFRRNFLGFLNPETTRENTKLLLFIYNLFLIGLILPKVSWERHARRYDGKHQRIPEPCVPALIQSELTKATASLATKAEMTAPGTTLEQVRLALQALVGRMDKMEAPSARPWPIPLRPMRRHRLVSLVLQYF